MARRFIGGTLVIASHNPGKLREIADLLAAYVEHFPSAASFGLSDPEETGESFRANAELKARYASAGTGLPALADDSGLTIPALGGAPGIHSARWAEQPDGSRDFAAAMARVNARLEALPSAGRDAAFVCALALAWPDGHCETVEGRVDGRLVWPPRGTQGFGYDPVFVPAGYDVTFAEMAPAEKHGLSHRADAFRRLVDRCFAP